MYVFIIFLQNIITYSVFIAKLFHNWIILQRQPLYWTELNRRRTELNEWTLNWIEWTLNWIEWTLNWIEWMDTELNWMDTELNWMDTELNWMDTELNWMDTELNWTELNGHWTELNGHWTELNGHWTRKYRKVLWVPRKALYKCRVLSLLLDLRDISAHFQSESLSCFWKWVLIEWIGVVSDDSVRFGSSSSPKRIGSNVREPDITPDRLPEALDYR